MSLVTCGICRKKFETTESKSLPFCSDRCRQVDLGRWLGERYSLPETRTGDEDDEEESLRGGDDEAEE
jgi:endogenous inhibitor of DNA gyrase (YacG/DUF329 family)